jgi:L-aminoadipate-semialdehyde dehydrogenase
VNAVTNTDDFIWRLVKGCIQIGYVPDINNTINMVPVDHVARLTSLATLHPLHLPSSSLPVLHVTASPPPTYNALFAALPHYGYAVARCEYLVWRRKLEQHIMRAEDNALFPLLHFVLDDLPTSTKAPELADGWARRVLRGGDDGEAEEATVDAGLVGRYVAWLVGVGFLEGPPEGDGKGKGEKLPTVKVAGRGRAVGRSGV